MTGPKVHPVRGRNRRTLTGTRTCRGCRYSVALHRVDPSGLCDICQRKEHR